MKSLTEIYTPLIKNLQDLNKEIRRRHSSMRSSTVQEIRKLDQWLEEAQQMEKNLNDISFIISEHLRASRRECLLRLEEDTSKD